MKRLVLLLSFVCLTSFVYGQQIEMLVTGWKTFKGKQTRHLRQVSGSAWDIKPIDPTLPYFKFKINMASSNINYKFRGNYRCSFNVNKYYSKSIKSSEFKPGYRYHAKLYYGPVVSGIKFYNSDGKQVVIATEGDEIKCEVDSNGDNIKIYYASLINGVEPPFPSGWKSTSNNSKIKVFKNIRFKVYSERVIKNVVPNKTVTLKSSALTFNTFKVYPKPTVSRVSVGQVCPKKTTKIITLKDLNVVTNGGVVVSVDDSSGNNFFNHIYTESEALPSEITLTTAIGKGSYILTLENRIIHDDKSVSKTGSSTTPFSVSEYTAPVITTLENVITCPNNEASIKLESSSSIDSLLYGTNETKYNPNVKTINLDNLSYNTDYKFVIVDNNGCRSVERTIKTPKKQTDPDITATGGVPNEQFTVCNGNALTYSFGENWRFDKYKKTYTSSGYITSKPQEFTTLYNTAVGGYCPVNKTVTVTVPTGDLAIVSDAKNNTICPGTNTKLSLTTTSTNYEYSVVNWMKGEDEKSTESTYSVSKAGKYKAKYTHQKCPFVTAPITISEHPAVVEEISFPTLCVGEEAKPVFILGGTWDFSFFNNKSEPVTITDNIVKQSSDIVNIKASGKDANNCDFTVEKSVVKARNQAISDIEKQLLPSCKGNSNGKLIFNGFKDKSTDYNITIGTKTQVYNGIDLTFDKLNGVYDLIIIDNVSNCEVLSTTDTIREVSDLVFTTETTKPTCLNGTNGSLFVSYNSRQDVLENVTYKLVGFDNKELPAKDGFLNEFYNLSEGKYTLTTTDNYCETTKNVDVKIEPQIEFSASISHTDVLCYGDANGTISIKPNNNDDRLYEYDIQLLNKANGLYESNKKDECNGNLTINNLAVGKYLVIVKIVGCNESAINKEIEITQPLYPLKIIDGASTNTSCKNNADGKILFKVSGGYPTNSDDEESKDLVELFKREGEDSNGNDVYEKKELTTDYEINSDGSNYTISKLKIGKYKVVVTDKLTVTDVTNGISQKKIINGCTKEEIIDVNSNAEISFTATPTPVDCFGNSTGVITISNVINGIPSVNGYEYSINKGESKFINSLESKRVTELVKGEYFVTVSDVNMCSSTETINIEQPVVLTHNGTPTHLSVPVSDNNATGDGIITVSAKGGTTPFEYSINGGDFVETNSFTELESGNYKIKVKDFKGCLTNESEVEVKTPEPISPLGSSHINVTCKRFLNGKISFTPTGGWYENPDTRDTEGYGYKLEVKSDEKFVNVFELTDSEYDKTKQFSHKYSINNSLDVEIAKFGDNILIDKLPAGEYKLYVYDKYLHNGERLGFETFTFNIIEPDELKLKAKVTDVKCYGGSDGIIELTASGGTEAYKFYKNNIEEKNKLGRNLITGLAANINGEYYTYSVEDAEGCQASTTATVEQPAAIDAVAILNHYGDYNITKNGGTDNITIKVNNGDSEVYKFSLGDSEPVETTNKEFKYNNLKAGSYNFKVSNGNCSFDINNVELKQPNVMLVKTSVKNVTCRGLADGSITADVTGGIPLGYKWTLTNSIGETVASKFGDNISPDKIVVDNLKPDTCTLKVENKFGDVEEVLGLLIKEPEAITVSTKTKGVRCKSGDVIEISPDVNGGSGQYNFQWFNSDNKLLSTAETYNATEKGDYTLKVTDKVCSGDNQVASAQVVESLIVVYPEHELVVNTLAPVLSNNKYTVKVAPTGGSGKYQYSYKNDKFYESDMLTFSAGGVYKIYVKDSKGCVSSKEIYLDKIKKFEISELTISNPKCFGEATGVVSANSVNGSGQVTYYLTLKSSANTINSNGVCQFNSLAAGEYLLYAKDSNGNSTESVDVVIANPEEIKITPSLIISPSCGDSNGEIEVVNSLNDNTVIYNWSSSSLSDFSAQGNSISNLKAGVYNVTANIYGCTVTNEISLNNPGAPVITLATIKNDDCGNSQGALSVNISTLVDSYDIAWNYDKSVDWGVGKTTPDITGLSAGKYTVNVTDKYNCSSWLAHNITQLNLGNVSYNISQPTNDTPAGKVTLAEDFSFLTLHVKGIDNAVDKTEIGSIGNLEEGEYTLDIFNSQCVDNKISSSFTIYELPTIKSTITSNTTCFGTNTGELTILAENGVTPYTYSIDKINWLLSDKLTNLHSGDYTVYVKDAFNRVASKEFVIKDPEKLVFNIDENNPVKCFNGSDGSVKFKVQSGVEPILFGDNKVNQTLSGGLMLEGFKTDDYKAYVVDYNNCRDSVPFTISQPDSLQVKFTNIINTTCSQSNGSVMATAIGGVSNNYNFVWPESGLFTNTLNNIAAGKYPVVVTDNNNCETKDTVEIADAPAPVVTIANVIAPLCSYSYDGSIEINILGGTGEPSVLWNDSKKQKTIKADNLLHGTYKATVIDENNCKTEITHNLIAPSAITGYLLKNDEQLCHNFENGVVEVTGAGGTGVLSYSIKNVNDEAFDLKSLVPGIYTVTITDEHGCVKTIPTELKNPAAIEINTPDTLYLCDNETLLLDAGHPQLFHSWSSNAGIFSTTQKLDVNTAGNYFIKITDQKGCQAIDSVAVLKQNAEIDANFILSSKAFVGDTIVFIEVSWPQPDSIRWSIPEQLPVIAKYGDYEVHVKATQEGMFYPGVTTYRQGCFKNSFKSIQVEAESLKPAETFKRNSKKVISSAVVYPNPNNGVFTADIVLSERVDIEVSLLSASGSKHFSVKHSGQMHYVISSNNVALKPGVYILRIVAGSQIVNKRVVVK